MVLPGRRSGGGGCHSVVQLDVQLVSGAGRGGGGGRGAWRLPRLAAPAAFDQKRVGPAEAAAAPLKKAQERAPVHVRRRIHSGDIEECRG